MPRNGITSHLKTILSDHVPSKIPRVTTVRSFATSASTSAPRSSPASKPKPPPRRTSNPNPKIKSSQSIDPLSSTKQQQQQQHSDLESFLSDAKRRGLDQKSTLFTGTRYEYLVASRLTRYGFSLTRVGKSSDYGIDLIGDWTIPSPSSTSPSSSSIVIRVLIQCKAGDQRIGPHLIRELEGSFAGAPPGWRGGGVLGLLVGERGATRGVREALGRADVPMGYVWCEGAGAGAGGGGVRQMLWNQRAEELGLEGVGVGVRRGGGEGDEVVLVRNGEPVPFV
ncbi:hypothetical protein CCMA1212_004416 [Trichoderma ghanense]|uniref:Required for respiratory growth protein 7, mitochondrial n=1 Tax=Trichoderma ghanense TaxID=65468 RepID=A0ABY2H5I7_9HYPO